MNTASARRAAEAALADVKGKTKADRNKEHLAYVASFLLTGDDYCTDSEWAGRLLAMRAYLSVVEVDFR